MSISIEINQRDLRRIANMLEGFPGEQRKAVRNVINDTGRAIVKRHEVEIAQSFDSPTRIVQKPLFVERATADKLWAKVRVKDKLQGSKIDAVLEPHVPEIRRQDRFTKGLEGGLRAQGKLGRNEYLIPARGTTLDRHGNITATRARNILNSTRSNTGQYVWAEIRARSGQVVKGVWDARRMRKHPLNNALVLIAVRKPQYTTKRFDFFGSGIKEAERIMPDLAKKAIAASIARLTNR